ncbi:MAG: fatty acid desaturase family protein [Candidatus Binatia bacterium]
MTALLDQAVARDVAREAFAAGARRRDAASLAIYLGHVATVLAPVYIAAWIGVGWHLIACWLWFGVLAHGLLLLLHECIHKLAFQSVRGNEALAYTLSPLFLTEFAAFRSRHWAHHRALGTERDPKYTYRVDIRGTACLRLIMRALLLMEGAAKMKLQTSSTAPGVRAPGAVLWIGVVQAGFLASVAMCAHLGHPEAPATAAAAAAAAYVIVYGYGMASLVPLVHTLRGVAEHKPCDAGEVVVGDAALRNFSTGLIERCIWGAYGFVDHATHHAFPSVPAYLLPSVTHQAMRHDPTLRPVGTHTQVLARMGHRGATRRLTYRGGTTSSTAAWALWSGSSPRRDTAPGPIPTRSGCRSACSMSAGSPTSPP